MSASNPNPLDILGIFDSHFGLLSALAALKEHGHTITNDKLDFDIKKFIIKVRQFMALEEAYTSLDYDKENSELSHLSNPDKMLFEKAVLTKNISNYRSAIFSEINEKYFTSHTKPAEGKKSYFVSKKVLRGHNKPFLAPPIKDALNLSYDLKSSVDFINYPVINGERDFKTRVLLTQELNRHLSKLDVAKFAIKNNKIQNNPIKSYFFSAPLSLACIIREYHDQTVVYVLCHYTNSQKKRLDDMSRELDSFIPFVFENEPKIKQILKKCASLCRPIGHKCFVGKILGTPLGSRDYCALFFVTFSNDIHKCSQKRLLIRNLIHNNRKRLSDWEFYRRRAEIYSFTLDDLNYKDEDD